MASNMSRMDSGFDESQSLHGAEANSVHNSHIGPRRPKSKKTPSHSQQSTSTFPLTMDTHWPNPDKRSTSPRKSTEPRRSSIASSSACSTAKSRGRGRNGSKPSSRRTSCTLIDPSRPARHYRVKTSSSASAVPTTGHDIDDVLALHFRSCSLFQNVNRAYLSNASTRSPSLFGPGAAEVDNSPVESTKPCLAPAPHFRADSIDIAATTTTTDFAAKLGDEGTVATTPDVTNTITHWTSPSTRRREYERIDKENSGLRGLVRKMVPRCVSGPPPPKFFEKDTSDTGSVRRYRMDIAEEDDEEDDKIAVDDEKCTLRVRPRKVERKNVTVDKTTTKRRKFWGCF